MSRGVLLILVLMAGCLADLASALAGAFLVPEGEGQFIAGVGYAEGSRRFDPSGHAVPAPVYRKAEASGYLEYGLTSEVTIVLAPTLAHQNASFAANAVTGSDSSAFGARFALFATPWDIVALQVLVQPPIGDQSFAHRLAFGETGTLATDLRVMLGESFRFFGYPGFLDVEPGIRFHVAPFPTEARLDLAFGVRPTPRLMVLLQTFTAFAPDGDGRLIQRTSYTKAQASLVYDLSRRWSVQAGGFRTIAGRNAVRETGPFGALWYRF